MVENQRNFKILGLVDRHGQSLTTRFYVGPDYGRLGNENNHLRNLIEVILSSFVKDDMTNIRI